MSVGSLVFDGPLLLAMPVAAAAGALTFMSPCVLPLVPGYLSYITGMSGASATGSDPSQRRGGPAGKGADDGGYGALAVAATAGQPEGVVRTVQAPAARVAGAGTGARPSRKRTMAGAILFVFGFSVVFAAYGAAFGGLSTALLKHQRGLIQILGVVMIALGLLFAGVFDRFSFAGRVIKPAARPKAGLAGAPLLGMLFGIGWTPCAGPTLAAVLTLGATTGTAVRGAVLAFIYALGVGVPFLVVALAVERGMSIFGFARRNARLITRIGGVLLITVGVLEVSGLWSSAILWLKIHWVSGYNSPL